VATARGYPNTSAEEMEVLSVETPAFTGDLLATGLQDCGLEGQASGRTGVDPWDVTDSRTQATQASPTSGRGTHEVAYPGSTEDLLKLTS
jgi:hypothetical protein